MFKSLQLIWLIPPMPLCFYHSRDVLTYFPEEYFRVKTIHSHWDSLLNLISSYRSHDQSTLCFGASNYYIYSQIMIDYYSDVLPIFYLVAHKAHLHLTTIVICFQALLVLTMIVMPFNHTRSTRVYLWLFQKSNPSCPLNIPWFM